MTKEKLVTEIILKYSGEDFYRFDLSLPKNLLGRGRKHELYVAPFEAKPWLNGDCRIPVEYLEGALIKEVLEGRAIISFILLKKDLRPFLNALEKEVDIEEVELVEIDSGTMGNKTSTEDTK